MPQLTERVPARTRWIVVGALTAVAGVFGILAGRGVAPFQLQFTPDPAEFSALFTTHTLLTDTRSALRVDDFFIISYVVAIVAWIWLTGRQRLLGSRFAAQLASLAAIAAGAADYCENAAIKDALKSVHVGSVESVPARSVIENINHFATAKWLAVGAVGVYLWLRALQTPRRRPARTAVAIESLLPGVPPLSEDPSAAPIGIACSGGGIRSACFNLGALQMLAERGVLAKASHVTAVSGGGYMAAGWAIASSSTAISPTSTDDDVRKVFRAGSTEESWLRRHSSLIPNLPTALSAVGRLVSGIAVNLLLMWLVLFMLARPAGWAIHEIHPELRGRQPYIVIKQQPTIAPSTADDIDVPRLEIAKQGDGAWTVTPVLRSPKVDYWTDAHSKRTPVTDLKLVVGSALVRASEGKLVIERQPNLNVAPSAELPAATESADKDVRAVVVARQVRLSIADESLPEGLPLASQFRATAPLLKQNSGTTGRMPFEVSNEHWFWVGAGAVLFLAAHLLQMTTRPVTARSRRAMRFVVWGATAGALGILVLTVVLPWLVYEVPPLIASLVTTLPGPNPGAASSSGATLAVAASGTGLVTLASVVRALRGSATALAKKKPLIVGKIAVLVVLLLVAFVVFIGQVQLGAANGPGGHLAAAGTIGVGPVALLGRIPDVLRWVIAALMLLGWRYAIDAHANSLFPFYKQRMSQAFAVRRTEAGSDEVPYETELDWETYGHFYATRKDKGPELVLCATVNAYGAGEVPSGRRSSPFTFSSTTIGGPDIGYVSMNRYHDAMSDGRKKDMTIPAAIAIAGAAFSPGMGKMSLGPIDNLMAVANARLGIWLPHPLYVDEMAATAGFKWKDRPGWPQFLREVLGYFRLDTPYVYVTDGGHWENLGMVELLRRGCRNVFVISAAGDGADSFSTIGEAIALAREQLGIKVLIDLEPMRAAWTDDPANRGLRRGKDGKPVPFAGQGYAVGELFDRNPDGSYPKEKTGTIVILEANMSSVEDGALRKEDWDVVTWAEGHAIFPDDSTLNQNFSHRQLESYRMRGRMQTIEAFNALSNASLGSRFGL